MNDRVMQFRVGVVVVATLLITAILILVSNRRLPIVSPGRYTIYVKLPQAPGVSTNTPVRKNGLTVGRVEDVQFTDDGNVRLTLGIDEGVKIRRGDQLRVRASLLGDAVLDFVPGGRVPPAGQPPGGAPDGSQVRRSDQFVKPASLNLQVEDLPPEDDVVQPGEEIEGVVVADPLEILANVEDNLIEAIDSVRDAGNSISQLSDRVNDLLEGNDEQITRIITKTETALDNFNTAMSTFDEFLGDEELRANLRRSLEDLPELLAETRETVQGIQRTVRVAEENLENLQGFTGPLGESGQELVDKVESSVSHLDEILENVAALSTSVNNPEGSVRQFLDNPDLYQNLSQAAANIEQASRQLKPTLYNVRVFTDKIARDPGRIGVSGVLRRESGVK
jgi:phospholipid/cholesterol/gamma-HCH transport system substrate-binding protein